MPKNDIAECRDLTQRHVAAFVIQTVFLSRQAVGSETHERSCSVFLRCGTAVAASTAFRLSLFTAEREEDSDVSLLIHAIPTSSQCLSTRQTNSRVQVVVKGRTHMRKSLKCFQIFFCCDTDSSTDSDGTGHVPCLSTVCLLFATRPALWSSAEFGRLVVVALLSVL